MAKKNMAEAFSAQVDAYVAEAAPFAQPILEHLRQVVHEGAPAVVETMKWSMPFFELEGPAGKVILGNMAAFKAHCAFGLWGVTNPLGPDGMGQSEGMGTYGKIASVSDLPPKKELLKYVREAARKIGTGERTKAWSRPKGVKAEVEVPLELAAALKKDKAAATQFAAMSASCRKEYSIWIAEAKREETRERRVAQAMEWIAEGKSRNWKYQ